VRLWCFFVLLVLGRSSDFVDAVWALWFSFGGYLMTGDVGT
jgi:hypothetical protein